MRPGLTGKILSIVLLFASGFVGSLFKDYALCIDMFSQIFKAVQSGNTTILSASKKVSSQFMRVFARATDSYTLVHRFHTCLWSTCVASNKTKKKNRFFVAREEIIEMEMSTIIDLASTATTIQII
jgi:hypothetical protein